MFYPIHFLALPEKKTGLSAFSVKEALAKTQGMPAGPLGQRLATSAAPTLA